VAANATRQPEADAISPASRNDSAVPRLKLDV
jgi:hypothetical protein